MQRRPCQHIAVAAKVGKTAPGSPMEDPHRGHTSRDGATLSAEPRRLAFLDAARGLAVGGMLVANLVNVFLRRVPGPLAHNQGDVLRLFDFPAPTFQFLIGVSLTLFLDKRVANGLSRVGAQAAALRRFVLLIGLGVVLDCFGSLQTMPKWGVLQTLGLGGVVATLVDEFSDGTVIAIALGLLTLFRDGAAGEVHGGPVAALAFVPLTLAGLLVGRGLRRGHGVNAFSRRAMVVATAAFVIAAGAYSAGVPFNKMLGTSSFVALTGGTAAALLIAVHAAERAGARFPAWLLVVGSNALTAWVLQYVLVYYPAWLVFPAWHRLALVPGMAAVGATLVALSALTIALGRRGIRIPI